MKPKTVRFSYHFKYVTVIHVLLILAVAWGALNVIKKAADLPNDTTFEVAIDEADQQDVSADQDAPAEQDIPDEKLFKVAPKPRLAPITKQQVIKPEEKEDVPEVTQKKEKEKDRKPDKKNKKSKIPGVKGFKLPPGTKKLSAEEIQRMLRMGAKAGTRNIIPDEDVMMLMKIKETFYDAWAQPPAAAAGNAEVLVQVRFKTDGSVLGFSIVKKSGLAEMDESVRRAVDSVNRVYGLSPTFLSRKSSITISFKVE